MNRLAPIVARALVCMAVGFTVGSVRADVRSPVKVRLPRESTQPAISGAEYAGTLEIIAPADGVVESVEIGGEGWLPLAVEFGSATAAKRAETLTVPFRAFVLDATKKLEVRVTFDGAVTRKRFDLSPQRFARRGADRTILRVESREPLPASDAADASGDSGTRGCDGQLIRLRGRFEYERAGRDFSVPPDGDFNEPGDVAPVDNNGDGDFTDPGDVMGVDNSIPPDGDFNDPADVPPAIIGADGIWYQIMDDDTDGDEVMSESFTDINGYFDVTICWDDDDILESGGPDIYIRFECDTGVVNVQDGYDPLEEDYSWSTEDDPWDDFTGNDLNFGTMRPTVGDDPAVHIHNSITRAHRFVLENNGDYLPEVDAQWPEDSTAYNPFFEDIYVDPTQEWNEGTQVHEWGHHLFNHWLDLPETDYCNGNCDDLFPNPCQPNEPCENDGGGHCVWCQENDVDAWNEGFANWMASVNLRNWQARYGNAPWTQFSPGSSNADNRYTLEVVQQCCNISMLDDPWTTEGFVAALLRDIEDPPQDPGQTRCPQDALGLGPDEILAVTRDTQPIRIIEFIERFRARYPQFDNDFWSTCQAVAPVYLTPWGGAVPPIQIVTTPSCQTYQAGQTIILNVQTNGSRFSQCMQWQRNGVALTDGPAFGGAFVGGSTTETLTITNATLACAGNYTLTVSSCDGPPPPEACSGTQNVTSAPIPVYIFGGTDAGHRITGWGNNAYGALGRGTTTPPSDENPADVINLTNAVSVSAGSWKAVAVLADGTAWSWGSVYLGNGTSQESATPVQVSNLTDVVAVSAGGYLSSMALDARGHVWTWGDNFYGMLGYPLYGAALNPGQVNLECVVDISMGAYNAAAVTSDGSLWIWGSNFNGELGQGTFGGSSNVPLRVTDLTNVVEVECGWGHTLARLADGTVWACGRNGQGQLGDGTMQDRSRFVQTVGLSGVTQIAAGAFHSLAVLSDSTPRAWGHNGGGELGVVAPPYTQPTPIQPANLTTVRSVDGGYGFSAFIDDGDGTIWTCGANTVGQLGRAVTPLTPAHFPAPVDTRVGAAVQISTGTSHMMVISPGARIIVPVAHQLVAGCSTAQLSVATVGEPPINYQWGRIVGGLFVPLNEMGGRVTGTTTPTLTFVQTEWIDSGTYQVQVSNVTNEVLSNQVTLSTPPFVNSFEAPQDAAWWNNERGNWVVTDGSYAAGAPNYFPATYSSFQLPQSDFLIELDVVNASIEDYNVNGGIWLHSRLTSFEPHGVVLAWGDTFPFGGGDIYWHRNYGSGWQSAENIAQSAFSPGQTIHLRVEVRGDTYAAYLNDSPTPITTFTNPDFTADRIALFDNAAPGTAFDNVFIQTLTNCDPGSGNEPVRIIQRPQSQTVAPGTLVTLNVVATGTGPLSYQWLRGGSCISGANSPSFSFTASAGTADRYECTVTNACGSVGSYPAFVTVEGGPPGDIDGDGHVTLADLAILLSSFGACAGDPAYFAGADLDGDNCVSLADLAVLLANFGG